MEKPHRVILDRVAAYADEATAYLRRRRMSRRPFARVQWPGGRSAELGADSDAGRALFLAASRVIDAARASDGG
jgi:hypothetical protein